PSGRLLSTPGELGVTIWTWEGKKRCVIPDAVGALFLGDERVIALCQTLRDRPGAAYTYKTVGGRVQLTRFPESPEVETARAAATVGIAVVDVREGSAGTTLQSEPIPGGVDHLYLFLRGVTSSGVYLSESCSDGREWAYRIDPQSLDIYKRDR